MVALLSRVLRRLPSGWARRHGHDRALATLGTTAEAGPLFQITNSLTRQVEPLPIPSGRPLYWYQCGPTVYDDAHLGHAMSHLRLDALRRILEAAGVSLIQAMSVTDIDDKIIARAHANQRNWQDLAREMEQHFWDDMAKLNVLPPHLPLRVSEHMNSIITFIQNILDRNHAYAAEDGSIYFDVTAFGLDRYGPFGLSESNAQDAEPRAHDIRSPRDFALWKASRHSDEPGFESPFGRGRPGCCFVHTGMLLLNSVKMSKSLGNSRSIRAFLADHSADSLRYIALQGYYDTSLDLTSELIDGAESAVRKLAQFVARTRQLAKLESKAQASDYKESVRLLLQREFNTGGALQRIFREMRELKLGTVSKQVDPGVTARAQEVLQTLRTLGFNCAQPPEATSEGVQTDQDTTAVLTKALDEMVHFRHTIRHEATTAPRENAMRGSLFAACDRARARLGTSCVNPCVSLVCDYRCGKH
ncbi:uncharacterized protein MONBRDRAFT_11758 [Monosiga brevicollis MX1]|uniref:tRNA synthetases class I catalytic domain-containing protein n=1 Tax=Monosiga brevicollis TaxID=81824 RepID=A9VA74_MONBE|nr:uncharacterized protein MONBRDRAFT_11758 [Monosiga brevicollis MX1]EDQ85679.1 predicted protein [Monosiga brevicollis MX1]|eukprot:XP_001749628.1 hypothetical protein [Monosiga brevicollis MX1]